jgi:nicotinamide mononucleotide adenylyltransferase
LRTHPNTFSLAKDPMDAEDWLKPVEKKLEKAQCSNRAKVLFAAHQLFWITVDWWETYRNTHPNVEAITWNEFEARVRTQYLLRGALKLKRKEFSHLNKGSVMVNGYLN